MNLEKCVTFLTATDKTMIVIFQAVICMRICLYKFCSTMKVFGIMVNPILKSNVRTEVNKENGCISEVSHWNIKNKNKQKMCKDFL